MSKKLTYLERQMALNGDFLLYRFHFLYLVLFNILEYQ